MPKPSRRKQRLTMRVASSEADILVARQRGYAVAQEAGFTGTNQGAAQPAISEAERRRNGLGQSPRKKRVRPTVAKSAKYLPLKESVGTGDRKSPKLLLAGAQIQCSFFIDPFLKGIEDVTPAAQSFGMTTPDLIDKWLTHLDWLSYIAGPLIVYAIAVYSGNLKTWLDFLLVTMAGLVITGLIPLVRRMKGIF